MGTENPGTYVGKDKDGRRVFDTSFGKTPEDLRKNLKEQEKRDSEWSQKVLKEIKDPLIKKPE